MNKSYLTIFCFFLLLGTTLWGTESFRPFRVGSSLPTSFLKITKIEPKPFTALIKGENVNLKCKVAIHLDENESGEVALVVCDLKDSVIAMVSRKVDSDERQVDLKLSFKVPDVHALHVYSTLSNNDKKLIKMADSKIYYVNESSVLAHELVEGTL